MSLRRIFSMVSTAKSLPYTAVALKSFFRWTQLGPNDKFLLIDNDGSLARESITAYPIILHQNSIPCSFAANANNALEHAQSNSSDLILLNNDLIFSNEWLAPLEASNDALYSPLCNRDIQYANSTAVLKTSHVVHTFVTSMVMKLEEYIGNEASFDALVEAHQKGISGNYSTMTVPFFCIRIPHAVYRSVGLFDEGFGSGGGEDYDYALRCHLSGFDVRIALRSYILHFYGKSTWQSESAAEQASREAQMFARFIAKWGQDLFELILLERAEILKKAPPIDDSDRAAGLRRVIETLKK